MPEPVVHVGGSRHDKICFLELIGKSPHPPDIK